MKPNNGWQNGNPLLFGHRLNSCVLPNGIQSIVNKVINNIKWHICNWEHTKIENLQNMS